MTFLREREIGREECRSEANAISAVICHDIVRQRSNQCRNRGDAGRARPAKDRADDKHPGLTILYLGVQRAKELVQRPVGGTGVGRTDATIEALAMRGTLIAHGIALRPGRTAAIGRIGHSPIIALPGAPDQALAAWWTLALPALERLSGSEPRQTATLPLARKIASGVGIAEIGLLKKADDAWMPLATGDLSLETIARADGWLAIPSGSEGYAAGTPVSAYMLRD